MQVTSSSSNSNNKSQDIKPEIAGNPFHILSDAYADYLSRGPAESLDITKKESESDEEKLVVEHQQDITNISCPPSMIDPNCSIHGLSTDQMDTFTRGNNINCKGTGANTETTRNN